MKTGGAAAAVVAAVIAIAIGVAGWQGADTGAPGAAAPPTSSVAAPSRQLEAAKTGPERSEPDRGAPASPSASATEPSPSASDGQDDRLSALDAVALLPVAGRAPMTGYERELFAYREVDHDRNGCDVRNDVLRRDLSDIVPRPGTNGCTVETGTLTDPYTGVVIDFVRGAGSSSEVQIDHVVSLGNAWAMGAQQWDDATRQQFGNDPLNLLAVDGPSNQQKGAGDAATWLPPNRPFRCDYVARQVSVKNAYGLRVTVAERDAMERVLSGCPDEPLLTSEDAATP